jgi:hypothetical protein
LTSPSFPPLPAELVTLAQTGVSLLAGTCSPDLVPECVRLAGLRVWPGACRLTVLLPRATGAVTVANLRANGRLAVTMSEIETLRAVQVKGTTLDIRDGDDADRTLTETYAALLRKSLAYVGLPEGVTRGLTFWPAWAVDMEIAQVFAQTPGPKAGVKMPLASGVGLP